MAINLLAMPMGAQMASRNVLGDMTRQQSSAPSTAAPQQPQRRRPNFFEVVGRIGDVMALMGGRDPLFERYQQMEEADQAEAAQQQAMQNFMANPNDEGAFRGLISVGFDPRDAVALRTSLAPKGTEPIKVGASERVFLPQADGTMKEVISAAPNQGTKAVEVQIAEMLDQRFDKETADAILMERLRKGQITPEVAAKIELEREKIALMRERAAAPPAPTRASTAAAAQASANTAAVESGRDFITEMRVLGRQARAQGILPDTGATPAQRATAVAMENIPLLERVVAGEAAQTREQISSLVTQNLPRMIEVMAGLSAGGRNFDAAKELDFWTKAFGGARTYPAFVATLDRLERKINSMAQASRPAPSPAPARQAPQGRNMAPPRRREGAPTTARRVNGRLVFE